MPSADEDALRAIRAASTALQEMWPEGESPRSWKGVTWSDDRVQQLDLDNSGLDVLAPQIGQLTALTSLRLGRCPLKELPPQIGQLTALTHLDLSGCPLLKELPPQFGQLLALTDLDIRGCEQLPLTQGAEAKQPAWAIVMDFARLLIVEPHRDTPGELHAFLLANPLAVPPFFKSILTEAGRADWLGEAVMAAPSLVKLTDADGRRAIDVAHPACKQAMQAALLLLGRYKVDDGKLLHRSATAAVAAAADHGDPEARPAPRVALKAMRGVEQVRAELEGRAGLDPKYVIAIKAVYADEEAVDAGAWETVERAAAGLEGVELKRVPGLSSSIQAHLFPSKQEVDQASTAVPSLSALPTTAGTCRDVEDSTDSFSWNPWCQLPRDALPTVRASLTFSMQWKDQGWGNRKGSVALFADGAIVYTTPTAAPHTLTSFESRAIELAAGVNNLEFKYRVGGGGGHSISITNCAWSWSPLPSPSSPPPPSAPDAWSELKQGPSARTLNTSSYKLLIVLELADRNLKHTIDHEHIAGEDWAAIRHIASRLGHALDHVHAKGGIHADLKPLNAVGDGDTWKIIDFDVFCKVGEPFGNKVPSSGYCPPEMAKVLLAATDQDTGEVDKLLLKEYVASEAYDLWSFGVVLYHLCFGRPLWLTDINDNITPGDLRKLAADSDAEPLRKVLSKALYTGGTADAPVNLTVATALLRKLLEPDAQERMRYFEAAPRLMKGVLDEPFFKGSGYDAAVNEIGKVREEQDKQTALLAAIKDLSLENKIELLQTRKALMKGIFEASEVKTPTTFIILDEVLAAEEPELSEEEQKQLLSLKEDGGGIELAGSLKVAKERLDKTKTWLERLQAFGEGVIENNPSKVFGKIKEAFGELMTKEVMYFYLVDELTGLPVRGAGYPIKITKPSELVHKLLPVMQVGMRAMSLYNGVAGIAQMVGYPVPKVPEAWRKGAQSSVEMLKQESSVEKFGAVDAKVQDGDSKQETTRGASLRELQRFFEEHDRDKGYAGLRRVADEDGTAVWTILKETDVAAQLEKRAGERRNEKIFSNQACTPSESADAASNEAESIGGQNKEGNAPGRDDEYGGRAESGAAKGGDQLQQVVVASNELQQIQRQMSQIQKDLATLNERGAAATCNCSIM